LFENLNRSIDELELSVRTYNCLRNANIRTIGELVQKNESELLKARNFGRNALNEIKEILTNMGLSLGCLNRLLSVARFLDSRCQSRLSSAWWRSIFKGSASSRTPHLRPIEFFITI